jgi:cephalosporin-C deacetylase-like acetyl esterase
VNEGVVRRRASHARSALSHAPFCVISPTKPDVHRHVQVMNERKSASSVKPRTPANTAVESAAAVMEERGLATKRALKRAPACTMAALLLMSTPVTGQRVPLLDSVPPDTALFVYDDSAPLQVRISDAKDRKGYRRADISWASTDGGRVPAWLYFPEDQGPHPVILLQHGMPGTRNSIHPLAEAYARAGAMVLAPTAAFSRPDPLYRDPGLFTLPTFDGGDRLELGQTVKDLRRAVDLLLARDDVDPERIAFVGISYGAWAGAVLSGTEHRIAAYGLVVGPTSLAARITRDDDGVEVRQFQALDESRRDAWLRTMAALDGRHFVAMAAPAQLRFDVAGRDALVPLDDALALAAAGSDPKVVEQWDTGHALSPEAYAAQARWLAPILRIDAARFVAPDFQRDSER